MWIDVDKHKLIYLSVYKRDFTTVYVLIFAVYKFSLYLRMNPRPQKLILAKICPGTVLLPVSD